MIVYIFINIFRTYTLVIIVSFCVLLRTTTSTEERLTHLIVKKAKFRILGGMFVFKSLKNNNWAKLEMEINISSGSGYESLSVTSLLISKFCLSKCYLGNISIII